MSEAQAPALPRESFKKIKQCRNLEELFSSSEFRERIVASVPRHMTSDRMLSVVLRAHTTNPLILKATPQSFAGACLSATNVGLEPNSPLGEVHLIPFKTTIRQRGQPEREVVQLQIIFGYAGLLKLTYNTGRILSVSANIVYPDADVFDWMEGTETYLRYKRGGRRDRTDADNPSHAFFHARLSDGGQSMEVWPWGDVLKHRNLSQAYRRAKRAFDQARSEGKRPPLTWTETPWVKFPEPMGRKTMIRAGVKYLPKSVELASAVRLDELGDRRNIDFGKVIDSAGNEEFPDYASAAVGLGEAEDSGEEQYGAELPPEDNQQQPAQQDRKTQVQVPVQTAPDFEAYLINDDGTFDETAYVDPVAWARAFIDGWTAVANYEAYIEHNADALEAARKFPIADQLLHVIDDRDLPEPATIPVFPGRGNKPDWTRYVREYRGVLFGWRGDIGKWLDKQSANIANAPMATRLILIKATRERCQQLGVTIPITILDLARPIQGNVLPLSDEDQRWVNEVKLHVAQLTDMGQLIRYIDGDEVQKRLRRLRPELYDQLQAHFDQAHKRITDADNDDDPEPPDAA